MEKIFDSWVTNHFSNAERFDGLLMWTVCTAFIWFWMVKLRKIAIDGMRGSNLFWEGHEQVIYFGIMMLPPVVFKASFISNVPDPVWWFMGGIIAFALLGRSALDYALAFFGRNPVKSDPLKVTTETVTETKITP